MVYIFYDSSAFRVRLRLQVLLWSESKCLQLNTACSNLLFKLRQITSYAVLRSINQFVLNQGLIQTLG